MYIGITYERINQMPTTQKKSPKRVQAFQHRQRVAEFRKSKRQLNREWALHCPCCPDDYLRDWDWALTRDWDFIRKNKPV